MLKRFAAALAVSLLAVVGLAVSPAYANSVNFFYASGSQGGITADGMTANFTIANPFLKTTSVADAHTLAEVAVESADQKEIIEAGWHVDKTVNGDTLTHLWAFRWVNGVGGGYNVGFTDLTGTPNLGDAITADVGTIKQIAIQHYMGNWFIIYKGVNVAYIPDTTWNAGSCACTFTQGNFFQVFGEVATQNLAAPTTKPCTDMGDGRLGASGGLSASISAAAYYGLPSTSVNLSVSTAATGGLSTAGAYSVQFTPGSNVRSFGYGGPGWTSTGTTPGNTGSC